MSARKRGLGRGLDALIKPPDHDVRTLPLDRLEPNRMQPRSAFDGEALEELARSIESQGMVQPIVVTPGSGDRFVIVAGERRWRAARKAGLSEVPVVVREVEDDRQLLELALVENLQRADLNPLEEALAYQALVDDFALSQEEVAARVGKGRSTVANSLRLLRLPEEVQELLRRGRLTAGQARPLLALDDASRQVEVARRAARDGLTARQLERLVAAPRQKKKRRSAPTAEAHTDAAAERLTQRLQTRVEIVRRGQGGVVRIHFHSEEELIRLFERLMEKGGER